MPYNILKSLNNVVNYLLKPSFNKVSKSIITFLISIIEWFILNPFTLLNSIPIVNYSLLYLIL